MKSRRLNRWKKSFAGKLLRRFLGEEKGAVMMEYVIIAVLIAAAVVVAVIMFGKNVSSEMNVATKAMSDAKGAATAQKDVQTQADKDVKSAQQHEKDMHNYK